MASYGDVPGDDVSTPDSGGTAIHYRVVPMSQATQNAISRNLELGREWRKGFDEGYSKGYWLGAVMAAITIFGAIGMLALALLADRTG